jgi:hypothetical protein
MTVYICMYTCRLCVPHHVLRTAADPKYISLHLHCISAVSIDVHYVQFRIDNHGEHTVRLRSRHLQFCSAADNRVLIEVPKW